jgi:hypothetical protein
MMNQDGLGDVVNSGSGSVCRTLVLCDGDVAGFHAAWAARERVAGGIGPDGAAAVAGAGEGALPLMVAFGGSEMPGNAMMDAMTDARTDARIRAVDVQARVLGLTTLAPIGPRGAAAEDLPGHREAIALVHACYVAVRHGCERVVWPAHGGQGDALDLDRVAAIADRGVLAGRLVGLDALSHRVPSIRVETPYADLTDAQVADLFLDAELSPEGCWWWGGAEAGADGAAAERARRRWLGTLEALGWRA